MNRWRWLSLGLSLTALVAALAVWGLFREQMVPMVPTHWDLAGHPDAWVPREDVLPHLLAFPAMMFLMVGLIWLLPWLSPRPFDVDRFRASFDYMMTLLVGMFGWFGVAFVWASFDAEMAVVRLLVAGCFVFLALLANVIGQARRNFWLGVRTPWTLASEAVWIRTHRLAAWLWTPCSALGAVAALAGFPLPWLFAYLMVYLLIPVPYSLIVYKRLERQGQLS